MSTPLELVLTVCAATLIGVGSVIVVLDTTMKHKAPEDPQNVECVQQGENVKCTPKTQAVTAEPEMIPVPMMPPPPPPAAERIEKVEETLDRIMKRLDRIEEKVEKKP